MSILLSKSQSRYTYNDYLSRPEDEPYEIIDGVPFGMTPAPSRKHQEISGELFRQFANYLIDKKCRIYAAPFDVRIPEGDSDSDEDITNVVQPDLTVVCDEKKLDERGCKGSPDLVIEIISKNTFKKDMGEKLSLYEKTGVKEYWVVYPKDETVMVFRLGDEQAYGEPDIFNKNDCIQPGLFPGLLVELERVFKRT